MKKLLIIALMPMLFFASCVNSLEDYNIDTKKPSFVEAEPLYANAVISLNDQLNSVNVNTNVFRFYVQHLSTTTYLDEPRYDMVTRTIPQALWNAMYVSTLADLKEAKKLINANVILDAGVKANQLAIIDMTEIYAYSILVNTFGDIPYTQALDIDNPQPVYDDAKTVYLDLLTRLDASISAMNPGSGSFGTFDFIYGGDVSQWIKFGNSLKLKLAMVLADSDNATASAKAAQAASDLSKLITTNDDNATYPYSNSFPNNNPLSDDVPPRSSRQDFVAANTLVDVMNNLGDPRRPIFFTALEDGTFKGGTYGFSSSFSANSTIGTKITATTFPGNMLDATEVNFLLAEAVERGYISGNAEEFYNNAVRASFAYWGAPGVDDYLASDGVSYATAGSSYKEKIGNQKWIALYNRGFDAWTDWRRLDFPALVKPDDASVPEIPTRFIYPIIENSLNKSNTEAAASKIGGDSPNTKLFWDVN